MQASFSVPAADMRAQARLHQATPGNAVGQEKIRKAAQEFEAMFISQMLEHMFAGVETDPMFGGGEAEDIYRSMLVDEYGKLMAKSGGIGVADHVMRQLLESQEAASARGLRMPASPHPAPLPQGEGALSNTQPEQG